jgi:hypothetical protein
MAPMRALISKLLALPMGVALLAMAACSGSAAVVTLTATPSSDSFVAYRVGLASVQLTKSGSKVGVVVLPAETTVDFTKLFDFSEVLGVPGVAKGTYTGALITLDYSAAQIIFEDGSLDGVELTPVDAKGKALGLVSVGVTLDPSNSLISAARQVGRLALDFDLAASNVVNLRARTITITPMISASTRPIDTKQVRIHGPILGSSSTFFATGVQPFDSTAAGLGQLSIVPSDVTAYEINGFISTGTAGQAQLAALPAHTLAQTFGTLSISTAGTANSAAGTTPAATPIYTSPTAGTAASVVSFAATQVLVDSSVQGLGIDVVSGVVSARSGNTLGIEDATLNQNGGTVTFLPGTTIVNVGPNTLITAFGQGVAAAISPQEISVGSSIEAFGTATQTTATQTSTATGTSGVVLDASTGRVRLDLTTAEGLVTAQGAAALTLNLTSLGGRSISAFDFNGSGAAPNQYGVATQQGLDLTNAILGAPMVVTGFPGAFGSASPNFTASTLLDPTTIQAELVVDWNGGTAAPFTSSDSTSITFNVNNSSIGTRHQIQIGSQIVDIAGLSSGLTITPTTGSEMVFSIGHSSSFTIESFDTYTAFITRLQSELNGALATGMTAVGQYTVSTSAFSASSITLFLND